MIIIITAITSMIFILAIAAVGGSFTERSGVINLSIEAFMTIGAVVYSLIIGQPWLINLEAHQFWVMPLAALFTGVFSIIYSIITVKLKANQTISGIALNIFAIALSIYLIHSRVNPGGASDKINISRGFFSLGENYDHTGWIFNMAWFIGIPVLLFSWLFINKTKFGNKIKACGEQPHAAASLGINVERTQMIAIGISATISGLAGALFAQLSGSFSGSTQGIGFLAVAMVIFGQWRTLPIIMSAVVFGTLYGLASQYALLPITVLPKELFQALPFTLSIGVLVLTSQTTKVPKALGISYTNQGR